MEYVISHRKDNKGSFYRLDIDFKPENLILSGFLTQIKVIDYPDFINDVSNSNSTGYEYLSLRMYTDIDCDDQSWIKNVIGRELQTGEIFLHHEFTGDTIIQQVIFDKILYDFSLVVLEAYRYNENVNIDYFKYYIRDKKLSQNNRSWTEAMKYSLSKLSEKISLHNN